MTFYRVRLSFGISAETPIHCIDGLSKSGLITQGDAELLRRVVRFRNLVVHEYGAIYVVRVRGIVESQGYAMVFGIIKNFHDRLRSMGVVDS